MAVESGTDDLGDFVHLEADVPNKPGILIRRSPDGPCVVTLYKTGPADPAAVLGLDANGVSSLTLYDANTAAVLTADSLARLLGMIGQGGGGPPPVAPPGAVPPPGTPTPLPAQPKKK